MITIRISGPGMDINLGVESLDDLDIVEAALMRVREHVAVSSVAKEAAEGSPTTVKAPHE